MKRKEKLNAQKQISTPLLIAGVIGLVAGAIYLAGYFSSGQIESLYEAGFAVTVGLGLAGCGWLVRQGRAIVISVAFILLSSSIAYGYLMGRGINFAVVGFGIVFIAWLVKMQRDGALA